MPYYRTCPRCGAHLDPGEVCDCVDNNQRFNQLLNSCAQPRAVYNALAALGSAGLLGKENAVPSVTSTEGGEVEQIDKAVSASYDIGK